MEPITITITTTLLIKALATISIALFVIKLLDWSRIINWFKEKRLNIHDNNTLALTITEHLENGNYEVIQCFSKPSTYEIIDAVRDIADNEIITPIIIYWEKVKQEIEKR
jgi:hypothetical protein